MGTHSEASGKLQVGALRKFKSAVLPIFKVGGENALMSYNKFVVIFRSTLLLGLASGTAWADHPIVSNISNPPGQPGQITRSHVASS